MGAFEETGAVLTVVHPKFMRLRQAFLHFAELWTFADVVKGGPAFDVPRDVPGARGVLVTHQPAMIHFEDVGFKLVRIGGGLVSVHFNVLQLVVRCHVDDGQISGVFVVPYDDPIFLSSLPVPLDGFCLGGHLLAVRHQLEIKGVWIVCGEGGAAIPGLFARSGTLP